MWVWVRSELRRRWASLVGLAVVIAAGAGAALALAAGAHRADTAYDRFAARTGAATIVMSELDGGTTPTSVADANRHLEVLDRVRALDGVESVQVLAWFGADPGFVPQTPNDRGLVYAFSQGFTYFDPSHPPFLLLAGTLPAPDDPEGVVINESAANVLSLHLGSAIEFQTVSPSRFAEWGKADGQVSNYDGPRIHTVVRAIARSFNELINPGTPDIAVMPGVARAMGDRVLSASLFVGVRIKSDHVDDVRTQLEAIYRPYGLVVHPGESKGVVTSAIRVEVTTLWAAALVAAVAALLVVAQFTVRSASSMAARHDARRALGMIRSQCAGGVALVLAPAVLVGVVVGSLTAYFLSGLFPRGLALRAEPEPGLRLEPIVLVLGGLGFLVALAMLVAVVAWRTGGVVRPAQQKPRVFTHRLTGSPQRVMGTSFALDPVGGRPVSVVAFTTLIGVALASCGLVAVTTIQQSRDQARSDHQIFGAPADYWFDDNGASGAPRAVEVAEQQRGVTAITRTIAIDDGTSPMTGPTGSESEVEPRTFAPLRGGALPTVSKGSMPRGDDEVALGNATARAVHARIGDTVRIGDVSGSTRTFRVVGLVVSWGDEDPGHAFIVNPDTLLGLLCVGAVESGCNLRVSVWANAVDSAASDALISAGFIRIHPPANLDRLQQVGNIPWYLAGVLGVLGLAGVGHALTTALRRRRNDLAIGRALGWTPGQSAGVLIWQAALTSATGGLVGAALGLLLGRTLWTIIADGLDIVLRPATPLGVAVLATAGVIAAGMLLAIPAFVWARRLRTAQILHAD